MLKLYSPAPTRHRPSPASCRTAQPPSIGLDDGQRRGGRERASAPPWRTPPLAAPSNASSRVRELVAVSCQLPRASATLDTKLAYRAGLTPTVVSVAPRRGSTAGGTSITLQVAGLPSDAAVGDVGEAVVGRACDVQSVSGGEIVCLTGSGPTSARPAMDLAAHAAAPARAAHCNATYEYVDLWSSTRRGAASTSTA